MAIKKKATRRAKRYYRRYINVNGKLLTSPRFRLKSDADEWYNQRRREKQFMQHGMTLESGIPTFMEFSRTWINRRMKDYPKATWYSDEQRLRDYCLPLLSEFPLNRIKPKQIRAVLQAVTDSGKSTETRTRVRALLSKLFKDALNEEYVEFNPVRDITFDGRRTGTHVPNTIESKQDAAEFIKCARQIGPLHTRHACLLVGTALRKSELLGLIWRNFYPELKSVVITQKVEQASLSIRVGTKGGERVFREVPIPAWLVAEMMLWRAEAVFSGDDDFILCDDEGMWIKPRKLHDVHNEIVEAFGRKVTIHELRHSYGRLFAQHSGNLKVLQAILGHSSPTTTNIYSKLAGSHIRSFGEVMDLPLAEEKTEGAENE